MRISYRSHRRRWEHSSPPGYKAFQRLRVPMVHVPYQGSAPAILNVVGGHVALAIVPFPDFLPFQNSLRVLARTGSGIEMEGWIGIFAPPETSSDQVARTLRNFPASLPTLPGKTAKCRI